MAARPPLDTGPQQGLLCCLEARVETCSLPWGRAGPHLRKRMSGRRQARPVVTPQRGGWEQGSACVAVPWTRASNKQAPARANPSRQASEPEAGTISSGRERMGSTDGDDDLWVT